MADTLAEYLAENLRRLPAEAGEEEITTAARRMAADIRAAIGEIGTQLVNNLHQRDRDELARLEEEQ